MVTLSIASLIVDVWVFSGSISMDTIQGRIYLIPRLINTTYVSSWEMPLSRCLLGCSEAALVHSEFLSTSPNMQLQTFLVFAISLELGFWAIVIVTRGLRVSSGKLSSTIPR